MDNIGLERSRVRIEDFSETSAGNYVSKLDEWISSQEGPWAACVNLMDAHYPYEPVPKFDRWGSPILKDLQDEWAASNYSKSEFQGGDRPWWQLQAFEALYDGSIRQLDAAIKNTIDRLKSTDILENTLIVVTSDHGEGFGEKSHLSEDNRIVAHGADGGIHDERTHVPLIVKFPSQDSQNHITTPATLTAFPDVVRSVLEEDWSHDGFIPDGPVLVTLDRGYKQEAIAVYKEQQGVVQMQTVCDEEGATITIRNPQTKYVDSDQKIGECRDILENLKEREVGVSQGMGVIDEDINNHLKDLGYIS